MNLKKGKRKNFEFLGVQNKDSNLPYYYPNVKSELESYIKNITEYNAPINLHFIFEMVIIRAVKQVYPNTDIKLCLWHMYRNLEVNRNKIYSSIDNQSPLSLNILKRIKTLSFMDHIYINGVYEFIKEDAVDDDKDKLIVNYFETTYLQKYDVNNWNYYMLFNHRTNNACESHNHTLNNKFNTKPSVFQIYICY